VSFGHIQPKSIIVDTGSWSGQFHGDLLAYLTGQVAGSGWGNALAEASAEEMEHAVWWGDHAAIGIDIDKRPRPSSLHPTPGWWNWGCGNVRDLTPEVAGARAKSKASARAFHEKHISILRSRISKGAFSGEWTREKCEGLIATREAALADLDVEHFSRCIAYQSVAIFVDEFPPRDVLVEFSRRLAVFERDFVSIAHPGQKGPLTVEGVRLMDPATGTETPVDWRSLFVSQPA
jgi:hypothetical protein